MFNLLIDEYITISEPLYNICFTFSNLVDTSLYVIRSQQFDNEKRKFDTLVGKLGEVASYIFLKNKTINLSKPDFSIYENKNKSWDYDLKSQEYNFHIKSQEIQQSQKFGLSWVFQKQDKHIFTEYKNNDYVVFVSVDIKQKIYSIKSIYQIEFLHKNNLFMPLKLPYLCDKLAVYHEHLNNI